MLRLGFIVKHAQKKTIRENKRYTVHLVRSLILVTESQLEQRRLASERGCAFGASPGQESSTELRYHPSLTNVISPKQKGYITEHHAQMYINKCKTR